MKKVNCIVLDHSTREVVVIHGMELPEGWQTEDVEQKLVELEFHLSEVSYMCSEEPIKYAEQWA